MRKQLRMSYEIDKITEIENDRRNKRRKYNKLAKENERLKKLKAKHLREIDEMNAEGDWNNKKDVLTNELRDCKTESRKLYYSNLERKKDLINKHENVVLLDKKIRNMQRLLDLKKKDAVIEEEPAMEENKEMGDLDEKVKNATKVMEFEEKKTQAAIQKQKADISNMEHQVEIAALKLRENEQENRL